MWRNCLVSLLLVFLGSCSSNFSQSPRSDMSKKMIGGIHAQTQSQTCTHNSGCSSLGNNYVCDYYQPQNVGGVTMGTCALSCNANNPCVTGICNPITGTCQPSCTGTLGAGKNSCSNINLNNAQVGCSSNSTSVSGYCYVACSSTNLCSASGLPSNTVCSRGVCVPPCGDCSTAPQTCDQTTGGCGISCAPGGSSTCPPLPPVNPSTNALMTTGCSIYSATCVPQGPSSGSCWFSTLAVSTTEQITSTTTLPLCETVCSVPTGNPCMSGSVQIPGTTCLGGICQIGCAAGSMCSDANQVCYQNGNTKNYSCQIVPFPPPGGSCPSGSNNSGGFCIPYSCGGQCILGSSAPTCIKTNTCGCTTAPTSCLNGATCNSTGTACICPSSCPPGETCTPESSGFGCVCDTSSSASSCASKNGKCTTATPATPSQCQLPCGSPGNFCATGVDCVNNQCQILPAGASLCGNGIVDPGEQCDEGALTGGFSTQSSCPQDFTYISSPGTCLPIGSTQRTCNSSTDCPSNYFCGTHQFCVKQLGNGLNGHCSNNCQFECAVWVGNPGLLTNKSQFLSAANASNLSAALMTTLNTNKSLGSGTCVNSDGSPGTAGGYWLGTADNQTQCPCGYGIWESNGPDAVSATINITQGINIFGGFVGNEKSIYDRVAQNLNTALGQDAPSGTVLNGSSSTPIIEIGGGLAAPSPSPTVILDGFQILGGSGGTNKSFSSDFCTPSPSLLAGGITVCPGATATLQNLRISGNQTIANGGGIRNLGTMTLSDSMVSLNKAQAQGGGISNEGGTATVVRSTFFGNGFWNSNIPSLCAAGSDGVTAASSSNTNGCPIGSVCPPAGGLCQPPCTTANPCPASMVCPTAGGFCTTVATCGSGNASPSCPASMTCPNGGGTCTGTATTPTSGGGIASVGGSLNVYASKFNGNYAYTNGGGIYSNSTLKIVSSLFAGNWASNAGGGIYLAGTVAGNLYNLTFVDNAAYNQGGGGIYNNGTGSTIYSSLFRDNKGLYPVNSNNLAEWGGNRDDSNFPQNQINSISNTTLTLPSSMSFSSGSLNYSYVDMCPIMAYGYGISPSGTTQAGVCDGSQTCGPVTTKINASTSSITFNQNGTLTNTCGVASEFESCTAPLYDNCSPKTGKAIVDSSIGTNTKYSPPYSFDLANPPNNIPTSNITRGAYQSTTGGGGGCHSSSDCPGLACNKAGLCVACDSNNPCSTGYRCDSKQHCVKDTQCLSKSGCYANWGVGSTCVQNNCVCTNLVSSNKLCPSGMCVLGNVCGSILHSNNYLYQGSTLVSPSGHYTLIMQYDGNLVLYKTIGGCTIANCFQPSTCPPSCSVQWSSNTSGTSYNTMLLDATGTLTLTGGGNVLNLSGTQADSKDYLAVQDDGNLVLYNSSDQNVWATNTGTGTTN